jgi:hypothetical protein
MATAYVFLAHYSTEVEFMNVEMRFLGIIMRVLRLEVSAYNVYITSPFKTTFDGGWGGGGYREENS